MRYSLLSYIAAYTAAVSAVSINLGKRETGVQALLKPEGGSFVSLIIENTGDEKLRLLNRGTILDRRNRQAFSVFDGDEEIEYDGLRFRISARNLKDDAFDEIESGDTLQKSVDLARGFDLSRKGSFDVKADGFLPFAGLDTNDLIGGLEFETPLITIQINGSYTNETSAARLRKRSTIDDSCSDDQRQAATNAQASCATLGTEGAKAARTGSAERFQAYFKTTSDETRKTVADRLEASANECNAAGGGVTTTVCGENESDSDESGCDEDTIAFAVSSTNTVTYCPLFFEQASDTSCGDDDDQVSTALHENTHIAAVFSPETDDFAYGVELAIQLSAEKAIMNADSHNLFARDAVLDCPIRGAGGSSSSSESDSD